MYQFVLEKIAAWAIPLICATLLGMLISLWKIVFAIKNGVQCMLRAEILRDHKEYVAKGFCPLYAKEALVKTYHAYHALGGNDIATQKFNEIMELPDYPPEKGML